MLNAAVRSEIQEAALDSGYLSALIMQKPLFVYLHYYIKWIQYNCYHNDNDIIIMWIK